MKENCWKNAFWGIKPSKNKCNAPTLLITNGYLFMSFPFYMLFLHWKLSEYGSFNFTPPSNQINIRAKMYCLSLFIIHFLLGCSFHNLHFWFIPLPPLSYGFSSLKSALSDLKLALSCLKLALWDLKSALENLRSVLQDCNQPYRASNRTFLASNPFSQP